MSSTTFTDEVTPIVSTWLNDVDQSIYVTVPQNTADIAAEIARATAAESSVTASYIAADAVVAANFASADAAITVAYLAADQADRDALAVSGGSALVGTIQSGTGAVARTAQSKLRETISPEDFGAIGDGVADDTTAWQLAVNHAQLTGAAIRANSSATYLLSRQGGVLSYDGINQSYYAVLITSPITIDLAGARFSVPMADADYCTAFLSSATTNVHIANGKFTGFGVKVGKFLYNGVAVAFHTCTSSTARNITSMSMRSCIQMYRCTNCRALDSLSELDTTYYSKSGTHFGCYSGDGNTIDGCVSYVSCGDGDIFLYGSGNRNTISNCKAFNFVKGDATRTLIFNIGQGMGADSGQRHATLKGNTVYGMYYGIDVKNDSNFTKVIGNTTISCKAGIVARLGEAPGRSYGIVIADNVINTMTGMTQFTYGSEVTFGETAIKTCGIYVEMSVGHTITGNVISVMGDNTSVASFNNDFVGIHLKYDGALDDSIQKGTTISGNLISHQTVVGVNNYYSLGPCLYVTPGATTTNAMRGLVVSNNKFDPIFGSGAVEACVNLVRVYELVLTGNSFSQLRDVPIIKLNTCNRATIANNSAAAFRQFLSATDCINLNISGNTMAQNASPAYGGVLPTIDLVGSTYVSINGNVFGDATTSDGRPITSTTSNWISIANNLIASSNYSSATFYSLDASAVNTSIANNLVN